MMRRQRRAVQMRLRAPDVAAAAQSLRQHTKGTWNKRGLRARVRDDGRVRARISGSGRYDSLPRLVGTITAGSGRVVLEATIRESYTEVFVPRLFVGLAAFMAAVCAALLAAGQFANPGIYICGIAAAAFGAIAYRLAGRRANSFRYHADDLVRAIRAVLPD